MGAQLSPRSQGGTRITSKKAQKILVKNITSVKIKRRKANLNISII